MKQLTALALLFIGFSSAFAESHVLEPSQTDLIILFSVAVLFVVGIVLYITREIIARKKTSYDIEDLDSKKNRDYEKYHSDWSDDYVEFGKRTLKEYGEEFKRESQDNILPNYYDILGVSKDATQLEIKSRFRKLVKELHPDKTKDKTTEAKLAQINKAYEVLSDPERRQMYDKYFK